MPRRQNKAFSFVGLSEFEKATLQNIQQDFDPDFYVSEYPDIASARIDPLKHYVRHGSREGRKPNRDFDPAFYRKHADIPEEMDAFEHYLTQGRQLGFPPKPRDDFHVSETLTSPNGIVPARRPKNGVDFALGVPFTCDLVFEPFERVAAIVHAFYVELMPQILSYLVNVPCPVDIYVTTDNSEKCKQLEELARTWRKGTFEIIITPNRGRDIAPFLAVLPRICHNYDILIHLHTKKSPHGGDPLEHWREYLLQNLLGSEKIVSSILGVLRLTRTGLVFPQHLFALRGILNWGYDFEAGSTLMRRIGVKIDKDMILEFPSGSMFWAKTAALKGLVELDLEPKDFEPEAGQVDGTLAHAIERILLMIVEQSGYDWAKVHRAEAMYPEPQCVLPVGSDSELKSALLRVFRPILEPAISGLSAVEKSLPQTRRFMFHPSDNPKPRLSLMVPSLNAQHVFGGIGTALTLLRNLRHALGDECDYRIITTDVVLERKTMRDYPEYILERVGPRDSGEPRVIVDGFSRDYDLLNLRKDETFIATAWWTAKFAVDAGNAQARFFGRSANYFYLVQDYEPNFTGWGSSWLLAENTYNRCGNAIAIVNSEELYRFLVKRKYPFKETFCLAYSMNDQIVKSLKAASREKIVLFYGRPSVNRNLFEVAIDGLATWQKRNPVVAGHWQIMSAGEDYPSSWGAPIHNLTVLGKMNLWEYAHWLSKASIGLSLMASPHPSYPPLEMAEAGLMTITNSYECKNLSNRFPNITSLDIVDADTISDTLEALSERVATGSYSATTQRVSSTFQREPSISYCETQLLTKFIMGL
jgi:O-antigen biosynthesis protein